MQVRKHLLSPCSGSHNAEVKSRLTDALMEVRKLHAEQIHSVILQYVSNSALKCNLEKEVSMGPRTTRDKGQVPEMRAGSVTAGATDHGQPPPFLTRPPGPTGGGRPAEPPFHRWGDGRSPTEIAAQ